MAKKDIIQQLVDLVKTLQDAREHSRNLGRMYEYMRDDNGHLVIDLDKCAGWNPCTVDWGSVVMSERCLRLVYTPHDTKHPIRFVFRYFYEEQSLWVFPERMSEKSLQCIIDWILKEINY